MLSNGTVLVTKAVLELEDSTSGMDVIVVPVEKDDVIPSVEVLLAIELEDGCVSVVDELDDGCVTVVDSLVLFRPVVEVVLVVEVLPLVLVLELVDELVDARVVTVVAAFSKQNLQAKGFVLEQS